MSGKFPAFETLGQSFCISNTKTQRYDLVIFQFMILPWLGKIDELIQLLGKIVPPKKVKEEKNVPKKVKSEANIFHSLSKFINIGIVTVSLSLLSVLFSSLC